MFATKLELFEEIVKRVHDGRLPAVDKSGDCAYRLDRTPECDIRCVAGLCIPDDKYNVRFEGDIVGNIELYVQLPDDLTIEQLRRGQKIHDSWAGGCVGNPFNIETPEEFLAVLKREWGIEDER